MSAVHVDSPMYICYIYVMILQPKIQYKLNIFQQAYIIYRIEQRMHIFTYISISNSAYMRNNILPDKHFSVSLTGFYLRLDI